MDCATELGFRKEERVCITVVRVLAAWEGWMVGD